MLYLLTAVASKRGMEVLHRADVHLKARHSAERILRCWGGQLGSSFEDIKATINNLIKVCHWNLPGSVGTAFNVFVSTQTQRRLWNVYP